MHILAIMQNYQKELKRPFKKTSNFYYLIV